MIFLIVLLCLFEFCSISAASAFDLHHSLFTSELHKYVEHNLVHYQEWQKHPANLNKYLREIEEIKPEEFEQLSVDDKAALWINAYNAFTIKVVLDHYPIKGKDPYFPPGSFRQIPDVWNVFKVNVAGKTYTLDQIEHDSLRQVHDPRLHFGVVCAAIGCAKITDKAFEGETLRAELHACKDTFLSDRKNFELDTKTKTLKLSKLFQWFPLDFLKATGLEKKFPPPTDDIIVLSYLLKHSPEGSLSRLAKPEELLDYQVVYQPFDWSLNDADAKSK